MSLVPLEKKAQEKWCIARMGFDACETTRNLRCIAIVNGRPYELDPFGHSNFDIALIERKQQ